MNYLALGDSISIDEYTGVVGGGAVSQFAALINTTEVQNFTRDGRTTDGVIQVLDSVTIRPDVITLTAGGNDLLEQVSLAMTSGQEASPDFMDRAVQRVLGNLAQIADRLAAFGCPVILNTIYDPTDGDDALTAELGVPAAWRTVYDQVNAGIRKLAERDVFLLADLQALFAGHGIGSAEPWIVMEIEPNHAGATAIARYWRELYKAA